MLKMCIIVTSILILTLLATLPSLAADTVKKVPTRDEIEDKYKWNLEDIYASTAAWEADLANAESMLPAIDSFKGRLGESGGTLFDFLKLHEKLWITVDQLYVYSYMKLDSDTRQSQYQELSDRIGAFDTRVVAAESFVRPEILAIEPSKLQGFFSQTPKLGDFRHYLEDIQRAREHTLTPEAEEVLASAGNIARGPNKLFTMLDDADIEYGTITDENGNKVELTKERYYKILESENRQVRREASEVYNGAYKNYMNTLAANLSNSVYSDVFFAKSRKYGSTLDYRL
ncbi:MAG: oligoendopeptidase F, partial [Candidatus Zixiibacteriota bacterium]